MFLSLDHCAPSGHSVDLFSACRSLTVFVLIWPDRWTGTAAGSAPFCLVRRFLRSDSCVVLSFVVGLFMQDRLSSSCLPEKAPPFVYHFLPVVLCLIV